jgi:hypothetical protein
MKITNAKYMKDIATNETAGIAATIDGTDVTVPLDPANRHYAEIQRQVKAGTLTIADAD